MLVTLFCCVFVVFSCLPIFFWWWYFLTHYVDKEPVIKWLSFGFFYFRLMLCTFIWMLFFLLWLDNETICVHCSKTYDDPKYYQFHLFVFFREFLFYILYIILNKFVCIDCWFKRKLWDIISGMRVVAMYQVYFGPRPPARELTPFSRIWPTQLDA